MALRAEEASEAVGKVGRSQEGAAGLRWPRPSVGAIEVFHLRAA